MSQFRWFNIIGGWVCFLVAFVTYAATMEPTASFWDCGEFIASAYKLQVGHPPGAPLFAMLGRLFSLGAGSDVTKVPWMINLLSAFASALTIAFLFWTITALVQKLYQSIAPKGVFEWDTTRILVATGAAAIGALAYTFSDTFWFSAVEGEVYATSSLFTALVFWAILKWDQVADRPGADRWLILIAYLMGLSVGIHLLNLLTIPALTMVYYFRKHKANTIGAIVSIVISFVLVAFIQYGIIPGLIKSMAGFEKSFVNGMGMSFNTGLWAYMILIGAIILLTLRFSWQQQLQAVVTILAGTLILQFSLPLVHSYGIWGLLGAGVIIAGAYFVSVAIVGKDKPLLVFLVLASGILPGWLFYQFVYKEKSLGVVTEKSDFFRTIQTAVWAIFMIMVGYSSYAMIMLRSQANLPLDENNPENVFSLVSYLNREQYGQQPLFFGPYYDARVLGTEKDGPVYIQAYEVVSKNGGKPLATFTIREDATAYMDSSKLKSSLTIRQRYVISDYRPKYKYDPARQTIFPRMWSQEASHIREYKYWSGAKGKPNFANNIAFFMNYQVGFMYLRYFMWNFAGRESDMQGHGEPMHGNWISGISFFDEMRLGYSQSKLPEEIQHNKGRNKLYFLPLLLGLFGLGYQLFADRKSWLVTLMLFFFTGIAIVIYLNQNPLQPRERDYAYAGSFYAFCIWIGLGALGVVELLQSGLKNRGLAAALSLPVLALLVPLNMLRVNMDDHNRAKRYTARDFAYNYLNSCEKNAILFTNGDNDTFPLWYLQEVEGVRTDVRIVNLSLLNTDWYITQMKRAAYDGQPVPFSLTEPEYRQGERDQVFIDPYRKGNWMNIKRQMEFLRKTDGTNKVPVSESDMLYYLPSRKFIIPVDSANAVKSGIVPKGMENRIQKELRWEINRSYVVKSELMIIDLLSRFNWERPVYFAITVGDHNYMGLEKYFILDGLAYRLVPYNTNIFGLDGQDLAKLRTEGKLPEEMLQRVQTELAGKEYNQSEFENALNTKFADVDGNVRALITAVAEKSTFDGQTGEVNTETMYNNYMKVFRWGNMNDPSVYLDETNMRMTMNFRNNFVRLASSLMRKGENQKAKECLDKAQELMPDNIVPYNYFNLLIANLYMELGENGKAKEILNRLLERTQQELEFYGTFGRSQLKAIEDDKRRAEMIAEQCNRMLLQVNASGLDPDLNKTPVLPGDTGK